MAKKDQAGPLGGGPTKIMRCQCSHAYQDKKYGLGMRVFNKGATKYKCTVCKTER